MKKTCKSTTFLPLSDLQSFLLNLSISGMEGNTRITITDATGKLVRVYEENLLGNDATLTYDIATFSQGIYFINVYNNETILTNKFIVTK